MPENSIAPSPETPIPSPHVSEVRETIARFDRGEIPSQGPPDDSNLPAPADPYSGSFGDEVSGTSGWLPAHENTEYTKPSGRGLKFWIRRLFGGFTRRKHDARQMTESEKILDKDEYVEWPSDSPQQDPWAERAPIISTQQSETASDAASDPTPKNGVDS